MEKNVATVDELEGPFAFSNDSCFKLLPRIHHKHLTIWAFVAPAIIKGDLFYFTFCQELSCLFV